ncbi:MAG: amidophosphoribosyltransferase [Gammaproteobacteria bacterium TMED78]|nr:MAG: amidophosphoribosyltransferase [Gammaproteobacteria bacterium TMED78]|tara:strand:- start:9055 stop:10596 length:1542 start_codon:yes stop_codon:yes gene_type:complete
MCGIVGIVGPKRVNQFLYEALTNLQHRGQDAAGIMTADKSHLYLHKSNGLVRDVFDDSDMSRLKGDMGIGHVRYPTAGSASQTESQPFYVNSPYGIGLAHNGNLVNALELKKLVTEKERRHLNTTSDTEILLNIFAHELSKSSKKQLTPEAILKAIKKVHKRCSGGYAVVALIVGHGIVAFRDPNGIRPLVLGKRLTKNGLERMVASESVALDALGFEVERDIKPGEALFIDSDSQVYSQLLDHNESYSPCIFEYVYFARPDSIMDRLSVYKSRLRMGEKLAEKILRERPNHDIDVVIPIPDTSRTAAVQVAHVLGVKYREGFIKNRYIGRTFIMPGQAERKASVKRKLNAIELEFNKKNVLLVDDSIVRGTTSQQIVSMARDAGAANVYFASAAPPVRHPNVYGIDMPAVKELIASNKSTDEVQDFIGADWLIYQDLEDLIEAVLHKSSNIKTFDTSCFSGSYVTEDVTQHYLESLELVRSDSAKVMRDAKILLEENEDKDKDGLAKIIGEL